MESKDSEDTSPTSSALSSLLYGFCALYTHGYAKFSPSRLGGKVWRENPAFENLLGLAEDQGGLEAQEEMSKSAIAKALLQ